MKTTLVLNASYEPLSVVSANRAISLLVSGKAVSLDNSDAVFRSEHNFYPVPWVVRLTKYVKRNVSGKIASFSNKGVLVRDGYLCAYCGRFANTVDHVIPKSKGGLSTFDNCVASCTLCNGKKGSKTLEEMNWELQVDPKAPTTFATILGKAKANSNQIQAWGTYLVMFQPDLKPVLAARTAVVEKKLAASQ